MAQAALAPGVRRRRPPHRGTGRGRHARSDAFGDALTARAAAAAAATQHEVERRTRRALHLVNLPTATDVRRLSEQVAALQRELRELQERRP